MSTRIPTLDESSFRAKYSVARRMLAGLNVVGLSLVGVPVAALYGAAAVVIHSAISMTGGVIAGAYRVTLGVIFAFWAVWAAVQTVRGEGFTNKDVIDNLNVV